MKFVVLFFLIWIVQPIYAQVELAEANASVYYAPTFYVDVINYKNYAENNTKTNLFVQVPYTSMTFTKDSENYLSKYAITFRIFNNEGETVDELYWKENLNVENFNLTLSKGSSNLSHKSFKLDPGNYSYKCFFEDNQSKRTLSKVGSFLIPSLKDTVGISDLLLVDKYLKTEEGSKILPNVAKLFYSDLKFISFFYETYSDKPRQMVMKYEILDGSNSTYTVSSDKINLHKGRNNITKSFELNEPLLGRSILKISLYDNNENLLKESSKKFYGLMKGFPFVIVDLDLAIDQLLYIARAGEISGLRDIPTYSEKIKKYIDFWKGKDPTPDTEINEALIEYFRRVEYAGKKFSNYGNGWRSDMGMVYITLGPPSQVERRPFEMNSKPYEVWHYFNINREFIFIDHSGFGDFRLLNHEYGEWFKFTY